jgi:uncharacterized protein (DUF305 family)
LKKTPRLKPGFACLATLLVLVVSASCRTAAPDTGPPLLIPGAPGEATTVHAPDAELPGALPHTAADVAFMQGMIHHHAQAVVMTDLARTRAGDAVRRMAHRIELSQDDEIAIMQRWLRARGEGVPEVSAEHMQHMHHMTGDEHAFMPGMLTHEQMMRLSNATGTEFDRLFLEYMIHHHEGALIMVAELFASEGAGYEVEIHDFARHVEADQSIEIRRMRAMLAELP